MLGKIIEKNKNKLILIACFFGLSGVLFLCYEVAEANEDLGAYIVDSNAKSLNFNTEGVVFNCVGDPLNETCENTNLNVIEPSTISKQYDFNFEATTSVDVYVDPVTGQLSCSENIVLKNNNTEEGYIRLESIELALNEGFETLSGNWKLAKPDGTILFLGSIGQKSFFSDTIKIHSLESITLNLSCDKSGILEHQYIGRNPCNFIFTYDYYCPKAYINFTQNNSVNRLTFYYDNLYNSREGKVYFYQDSDGRTRDYMAKHIKDVEEIIVDISCKEKHFGHAVYLFGVEQEYGTLDNLKKIDMTYLDVSEAPSFKGFMQGIPNLEQCIGLDAINVGKSTSFEYMFWGTKLPDGYDLSKWNTENVTNMNWTFFQFKSKICPNVSSWNTSKVTSCACMFCYSLIEEFGNLNLWDTSSLVNINCMFKCCYYAKKPPDFYMWNTSKLEKSEAVFSYFGYINGGVMMELNFSNWNWTSVKSTYEMFGYCTYLKTIYCNKDFNELPSLQSSTKMFCDCKNLSPLLSSSSTPTDCTYAYPKTDERPDGFFTSC